MTSRVPISKLTVRFQPIRREKAGLKITGGHRTMSGQDDYLSGQNLGLAVILTGQVNSEIYISAACSYKIGEYR